MLELRKLQPFVFSGGAFRRKVCGVQGLIIGLDKLELVFSLISRAKGHPMLLILTLCLNTFFHGFLKVCFG